VVCRKRFIEELLFRQNVNSNGPAMQLSTHFPDSPFLALLNPVRFEPGLLSAADCNRCSRVCPIVRRPFPRPFTATF
jgi:hypothetical protein